VTSHLALAFVWKLGCLAAASWAWEPDLAVSATNKNNERLIRTRPFSKRNENMRYHVFTSRISYFSETSRGMLGGTEKRQHSERRSSQDQPRLPPRYQLLGRTGHNNLCTRVERSWPLISIYMVLEKKTAEWALQFQSVGPNAPPGLLVYCFRSIFHWIYKSR